MLLMHMWERMRFPNTFLVFKTAGLQFTLSAICDL